MRTSKQSIEQTAHYVEQADDYGNTALLHAAADGKIQAVQTLLAAGANCLTSDQKGWTPMHFAAANGYVEIMNLIFQHNTKTLEQPDCEGRTPLQRACYYGRLTAVQWFSSRGADLECPDDKGKTALHSAVCSARIFNKAVIDFLLAKGAQLEAKTDLGWTPLFSAARYGNAETVGYLIVLGGKYEAENCYGETPLNCIISADRMLESDKIPIVNALLTQRVNVNTKDTKGRTPLHWACILGSLTITTILANHAADLEATDENGLTPLHQAAKADHAQLVDFLIKHKKRLAQTAVAKSVPVQSISAEKPTVATLVSLKANYTMISEQGPQCKEEKSCTVKETSEMSALLKAQQAQISALQQTVKLQATAIELLQKNQEKLQAALVQLTIKQRTTEEALTFSKISSDNIPKKNTFF